MVATPRQRRNRRYLFVGAILLVAAIPAGLIPLTADAGTDQAKMVAVVPTNATPKIMDGHVETVLDAGSKVIAGGNFTTVANPGSQATQTRRGIVAFNKSTGALDSAFMPTLNGDVFALIAGPTAGTVYVGGTFSTVSGVARKGIALLNVADGTVVTSFVPPVVNGQVHALVKAGNRLLLGGSFTKAGSINHAGLASLNATTGKLDPYLNIQLTGHHNYNGSGAQAPVGPDKLALSPDGTKLIALGNFKNADGVVHDQVAMIDLGATAATIANWNTTAFNAPCMPTAFDSWVRDVAFSPDGTYFVVDGTGGAFAGTLCDSVSRWETSATGSAVTPTWVNYSGGDTFLSVDVTSQAVYVGGHFRWVNNSTATNSAMPGGVGRASIAALDPLNGLPLPWNPGRNPRGYGVTEMNATADGLWLGYDTGYLGNRQYHRLRVGFFPLASGASRTPQNIMGLPGKVYVGGTSSATDDSLRSRSYDGVTSVGPATAINGSGIAWHSVRGAVWIGGTLYYGMSDGKLYKRSFNGTAFGAQALVDPYHDAYWDKVLTGENSTQTFAGAFPTFYGTELANLTGLAYANGKIYYTLAGSSALYARYFSADGGVVGADRFTVSSSVSFADSGGLMISGNTIYMVSRTTGNLASGNFTGGVVTGAMTTRSGPFVDGNDWRGKAHFMAP